VRVCVDVRDDASKGDGPVSNAIAHHSRRELDGREVRSESLALDRNGERRRGVLVVVTASAGIWATIAAAAWVTLRLLT
jgi:hypothetical protein